MAEATGVTFAYDSKTIVRDLSTTIMRGDKIGIIGPNGSGKTTLLRLLLGEVAGLVTTWSAHASGRSA